MVFPNHSRQAPFVIPSTHIREGIGRRFGSRRDLGSHGRVRRAVNNNDNILGWSKLTPNSFSDASPLNMVDRRFRGDHYAERAHRLLDLRVMSIATIQACILLGTLCFAEGRTDSESLYYAAANRLALLMDLPRRPVSNELERQINLRGLYHCLESSLKSLMSAHSVVVSLHD